MNKLFIMSVAVVAIVVIALAALIYVPQQWGRQYTTIDLSCDNGTLIRLSLEVADTPAEHSKGLMNRTSLDPGTGMLFVFDNDERRYFWMENTLIPLDMIFIANDLTIVDIHNNATPMSRDAIASSRPCRYVLEVNGGMCDAIGIDVGERVLLDIDGN